MRNEARVWLVRAGGKDEAKSLFLDAHVIALGPAEVADLTKIGKTRDDLKACYREAFPDAVPTAVNGNAGQLFRFIYEATEGDYILYPSKDGGMHIGKISGTYMYDETQNRMYPHRRKVKWLQSVRRSDCSQQLLNEARAFKRFYGITKCADEVVRLASFKAPGG